MLLEKNSWNRIVQFPLELVWWKNREFLYFNLLWSSLLQKNSWKRVWQFALKLISRENSLRTNSRIWVIWATCLCFTVWKFQKFTLTPFWQIFRESNGLLKKLLNNWFDEIFFCLEITGILSHAFLAKISWKKRIYWRNW